MFNLYYDLGEIRFRVYLLLASLERVAEIMFRNGNVNIKHDE